LKLNGAGSVVWATQTGADGEDWGGGLAVDRAGNVYLAGATYTSIDGRTGAGGFDAVLVKHDSTGARQWIQQFGTAGYDYGGPVATDAAGNVYATGQAAGSLDGNTFLGETDVYLVKFDSSGSRLWTQQFGTAVTDYPTGVVTDAAGNVYVCYYPNDSLGVLNGQGLDAYLVKYDGDGTLQWKRTVATPSGEAAGGVAIDGAGNIYMVGQTAGDLGTGNLGSTDSFVAKFDAAGNQLWVRQFGTAGAENAEAVAVDAAGNVYVAGNTAGFDPVLPSGQYAGYVAKFDSAGTFAWVRQTSSGAAASAVAVDGRGDVYLAGGCLNNFDGQNVLGGGDIFVMKFSPAGVKY